MSQTQATGAGQALEGIRVLDLGLLVQGPQAAQLLALAAQLLALAAQMLAAQLPVAALLPATPASGQGCQ